MGQALGWQEMAWQNPYIDGMAFIDKISRDNANHVDYSFNLCMHVRKATGYWNYGWYVDMQCGNHISDNRLVKPRTSGSNLVIGGIDYYQSVYNGNFEGRTDVGGKDTQIVLRATFHDTAGNWGNAVYWGCSIPTASSMSAVRGTVSSIDIDSAKITGSVDSIGAYSTITKWRLEYGVNRVDEHTIDLSGNYSFRQWSLSDLEPDTRYVYRITCWNSAGYSQSYSNYFKTKEEDLMFISLNGEPYRVVRGYVIKVGSKEKIRKIRKVDSL